MCVGMLRVTGMRMRMRIPGMRVQRAHAAGHGCKCASRRLSASLVLAARARPRVSLAVLALKLEA